MDRLAGKVAIVTGAASGNGRAMAVRFAAEGADVVVADVDAAGAEETARLVGALGRRGLAVRCDVSHKAEIDALVAAAAERLGRVDIAVANAGVVESDTDCLRLTEEQWQRTIGVNLTGRDAIVRERFGGEGRRAVEPVEVGGVPPENRALHRPVGRAKGAEAVPGLEILGNLDPAESLDLPLRVAARGARQGPALEGDEEEVEDAQGEVACGGGRPGSRQEEEGGESGVQDHRRERLAHPEADRGGSVVR
jgi:hypothetical protein